jgi:N-acetylmuramic acid 6-phosphate etherase
VTFTKTTEQSSKIRTFRKNVSSKLLSNINQEDKTVPFAVEKSVATNKLVTEIVAKTRWTIIHRCQEHQDV